MAVREDLPKRNTGRANLMLDQFLLAGTHCRMSPILGCVAAQPCRDFRNANTGAGQDFTGLTAVVQLRLRVAILSDGDRASALSHLRVRSSSSGLVRGDLVGGRDQPGVCFIEK